MKEPASKYTLTLNEQERRLLLDNAVLSLPITAAITRARKDGAGGYACEFTSDNLIQFGIEMAKISLQLKEGPNRDRVGQILERINDTLGIPPEDAPSDEEASQTRFSLPPTIQKELDGILRRGDYRDLDDLNDKTAEVMTRYNRTGQEVFGGLSPDQVGNLVYSDWESPDSPIQLASDLSFEELEKIPFFANARLFLKKAIDGVKATAKGNLTRKFVGIMLEEMDLPPGYVERVKEYNKVVNEDDLRPLHILRIQLDLSRLLRTTKGTFWTTKKGQTQLSEKNAGKLYEMLFRTYFLKFSLAYADHYPEEPSFQDSIGYSLFQCSRCLEDWRNAKDLPDLVLLPNILERFHSYAYEYLDLSEAICRSRLIMPLVTLGLLDRRELPSEDKWSTPFEVRKTELFDRFLKFEI